MKRINTFALFAVLCSFIMSAQPDMSWNPLAEIRQTPGFCSIFHEWGFIGDSLSSGEHEHHNADGSTGYADLYAYSWGMRMCAAMGVNGEVYAQGGETTKGWIEHFWDMPNNRNNNIDAKANPKQVYVIALGVNDTNMGFPLGNVATDIDTLDYKKNAETFAGCYAGIIQRLKSIQPEAKFFVVTRPRQGEANYSYNDVIRSMADIFDNVYVVDLYKYGPDYTGDFNKRFFMGGHLTAAGYQLTAYMMLTYIDWIINKNIHDFDQAAFIGTGMKY